MTAGLKSEPLPLEVLTATAGDEEAVPVVVLPPELPSISFRPLPHGQVALWSV